MSLISPCYTSTSAFYAAIYFFAIDFIIYDTCGLIPETYCSIVVKTFVQESVYLYVSNISSNTWKNNSTHRPVKVMDSAMMDYLFQIPYV